MQAKPLYGNKQWVRDYNWLKQLAAMNINHPGMTIRLTAVLAAILLVGCSKPQPPTVEKAAKPVAETPVHLAPEPVEPSVKEARPELPVDKPTAKLKTPEVSLWEAARTGNIEEVKLHLSGGFDSNTKDEGGWVPLHGASGSGQKEIVELLLVNGANVNATALSGKTALDYAVKAGHKETADLLRQHGGKKRAELQSGVK